MVQTGPQVRLVLFSIIFIIIVMFVRIILMITFFLLAKLNIINLRLNAFERRIFTGPH